MDSWETIDFERLAELRRKDLTEAANYAYQHSASFRHLIDCHCGIDRQLNIDSLGGHMVCVLLRVFDGQKKRRLASA